MIKRPRIFTVLVSLLFVSGFSSFANAQEAPVADAQINAPPEVLILEQIEADLKEKYKKEIYIPPSIQSLFFTPSQQALLRDARAGFKTALPAEEKEEEAPKEDLQQNNAPAIRSISLSGIVFITPDEWTIWLNKQRVTAAKLPKEAVDLRVYKDFIELRWHDTQTNKIFPIRLRPNQTFNLDAQTFVPG